MKYVWKYKEQVDLLADHSHNGLVTFCKIRKQVALDLHRMNIYIDDIQAKSMEQFVLLVGFDKKHIWKLCTQVVFAPLMERLMTFFPTFHVIHDTTSNIQIDISTEEPNSTYRARITFKLLDKKDLKQKSTIQLDCYYNLSTEKGCVLYCMQK